MDGAAVIATVIRATKDHVGLAASIFAMNFVVHFASRLLSRKYREIDGLVDAANWTVAWVSIGHAACIAGLTIPWALGHPGFITRGALDDPMPPPVALAARLFFAYHIQDFAIVWLVLLRSTKKRERVEQLIYLVHHSLVAVGWAVFLDGHAAPLALLGMMCEVTSIFINARVLLIKTGQGSGPLYIANIIVLLLAWYATRVVSYIGGGAFLMWRHAATLRAQGLVGGLTVSGWALAALLQLQWTYRLTAAAVKAATGDAKKEKAH